MSNGLPGCRLEVRPEIFISPWAALYAKAGYLWMPSLKVREVHAAWADWYFYQEEKDPDTWLPDDAWTPETAVNDTYRGENLASWIYYGFNPLLRPDGGRYRFDLSSFYAQAGLSFYF